MITIHQCEHCEKICRSYKHKLDHQKYVCHPSKQKQTTINISNLTINIGNNENTYSNNGDKKDYIYLIHEREFKRFNEPIYKFGKTVKLMNRMRNYPKNSDILLILKVENCDIMEKIILKKLRFNFKQRKDIGAEYFEGELYEIIKLICLEVTGINYCDNYDEAY